MGVASVPQTFGKNDCFKGFGGEMSLYDNLRSSVPVIDAAIGKIVRLTGGFNVECEDSSAQDLLSDFLENVPVGGNMTGNSMGNGMGNGQNCPVCPSMPEGTGPEQELYRVQAGAFRDRQNADNLLSLLENDGFPAYIIYQDGLYKVQVGAYARLSNAIAMEREVRQKGYNTYITT